MTTALLETRTEGLMRILLVDDDQAFRRVLATGLRHLGYEVVEAGSGLDARRHLLRARKPTLVVSDVNMPDCDGLELLEWWRARGGAARFVMVTAFSTDNLRARTEELGALTLLDKPFELEELDEIIRSAGL